MIVLTIVFCSDIIGFNRSLRPVKKPANL